MQAMINLYETFSEALHTIQELEAVGILPNQISLITKNGKSKRLTIDVEGDKKLEKPEKHKKHKIAKVAPKSAESPGPIDQDLKAEFFDLLNLHELAGLGAIVGAGWVIAEAVEQTPSDDVGLVTTEARGLLESLVQNGLDREHAETYIEGLKRSATLVAVKIDSPGAERDCERVMREDHRPMDPHMRGHHYWTSDRDAKDERNSQASRMIAMLIATPQ